MPETNDNTFPGITNNFLEVLGPILRYDHAQNQGYGKNPTILRSERQSGLAEVMTILKNNENSPPEINYNFSEVLSPILRYHHAQNQGFVKKKQMILGIERQSDLPYVLYILKNNINTFSEMNNQFPEVLGPNLRYHHAQNQGYVRKNRPGLELNGNLTDLRSYTSSKTMEILSQK